MTNPYANRGFGSSRLLAKSGTEEDVSSSSDPLIDSYDRQEFEMQVGRAMDTLRDDYPEFLAQDLDYSIYDADLELIDPSGFHLNGVKNYENAIRLVHTMVGIFYCTDQSDVKFRMCFDKARQNIRIHWNARVVPKAIFGGYKTTLHVDGISIYELDRMTGNITQHRLERLVMNDNQLSPEQGIFAALRNQAIQSQVDGIPSFSRHMEAMTKIGGENIRNNIGKENKSKIPENILRFQNNNNNNNKNRKGSLLFGDDNDKDDYDNNGPSSLRSFTPASSSSSRLNSSSDQSLPPPIDANALAALEKKNLTRKKFGLKPIDMEEFLEIEKQVAELAVEQQKKAAAEAVELERQRQQEENAGGFFGKLFGNVLKDTCESNYDCERPEVCCDFGIKKMCCSSGQFITNGPRSREGELALIPVPITNPNPYPGNDPRNRDPYFR
eukprot:CAMPEP_0116150528 /NCGR_PEP_ID=MMETSP0329-20121206/19596_1 /TAXON_ID=697910 /ORGANISM="Pseudo-nitzschia arenysensis, Strain B593" /LENGTH=439 /DNA_ID=CAMNT_0003647049 /DNA_START=271 /DNA_END=1590 /DNA_ORIENTATION=-